MSDTQVPELPLDQPEVVPDAFQAEFPCPKCGKTFPTRNALQGHQTSHRQPLPCPECGKVYRTAGALGNHRKQLHHKDQAARQATPSKPKPTPPRMVWHADDIFESVVASLWPSGLIPVRCILPMVEWREATREFLEKVQSE